MNSRIKKWWRDRAVKRFLASLPPLAREHDGTGEWLLAEFEAKNKVAFNPLDRDHVYTLRRAVDFGMFAFLDSLGRETSGGGQATGGSE